VVDAHRQRSAVCQLGRGRAVAAGGVVIKLGIVPERIEAGHPEQNGRHERMHRTLKLELHPAQDWRGQQRELTGFVTITTMCGRTRRWGCRRRPACMSLRRESTRRRFRSRSYSDAMLVRSVKSHGHFRWKKHDVFLSEVLWGERVGLLPVDDESFTIYFAHMPLARFDKPVAARCTAAESCNRSQKHFIRRGHAPAG